MSHVQSLIDAVGTSRKAYLATTTTFTEMQASWRPDADTWNVCDITEHLFWAEQGGIYGMWKILFAIRAGMVEKTFESVHKHLPIETIIAHTWQPKEKVAAVAAPRLGGTLAFWASSLSHLQLVLSDFGKDITDEELRLQAHPHPISGAMDFQQRLEFLKFHIERHHEQVLALKAQMPTSL